jgi:DNA topoisomerase-6 subunit A
MGDTLATPEARFIGVTISDIEKYDFLKNLTLKATDVDLKRAQDMLSYQWINVHEQWSDELKKVIKLKLKLESDALQGPRLTFVQDYIKEKIRNKDFLP